MAEALIQGLLAAGVTSPAQLCGAEPRADRRALLAKRYGLHTVVANGEVASAVELLVLAVKPGAVSGVLREIAPALRPQTLVVSIAAGVPLAALEAAAPAGTRVLRAMPNSCALVGAGATAIAPGRHAEPQDLVAGTALFSAVGTTHVVDESQLDAVTGLSGSGPAFVLTVLEALADGGVLLGLPRELARALANQTVLGAARLAASTVGHPAELRDRVTSPGGTTIAGLRALEAGGLRAALFDAVEAATLRARELAADAEGK
jgi:pyrroline-5-carboxylate reductase